MNTSITKTKWVKFGKSHDFVFVGKETIATASGIHVSFLEVHTKEKRIECFDSKERGNGASCLAGHSVVPMFSVVERKPNPKISIFVYPTIRRISRCVLPEKINGYLSCYFAGTEYLLSLTSFPDFRLIVWLWKTGKPVAVLDTKINSLTQEICCSPNPPHLISQLGVTDGTVSIYQVRVCSKIVSVHHVDVPLPEHKIASLSWTIEGNLFVSDEFGNVWLVAIEASKLYSVVKSEIRDPPRSRSIIVAYKGGVIVTNVGNEIAFYKKSSADWNVSWQFTWSISTIFSPIRAVRRHSTKDGILLHSESGEVFEISIQHDNVPQIEILCADDMEYKALLSVAQRADHVAAVDRLDRLCIFELLDGRLIARLSLKHHGEVLRVDSHPTLPMLASCSLSGNCILIDVTNVSSPRTFNCFHLHEESLDRIKFSRHGELLVIANSRIGRIFLIAKPAEQRHVHILGFVEIDGHVADFLLYERGDNCFNILVLALSNTSAASVGGDKVIIYYCEVSDDLHARVTSVIDLTKPFRTLSHGGNGSLIVLGVPFLTKQLHQMEIQNNFRDIALTKVMSSMHQLRNIGIHVSDFRIVTYGYDGLIVVRDSAELRRVHAIFMPHHRSEGGIKCAIHSRFGETIISLGRNGDLVASRVRLPEAKRSFLETQVDANVCSSNRVTSYDLKEPYNLREETWLDSIIATKLEAEQNKILPVRAAILTDLIKIKEQIRELLDVNESEPPDVRLPVSAFDLDLDSRQRRIDETRLARDELHQSLVEQCEQRDRIASHLREIFWTPLKVKPCALRSINGDTKIQNYPLVASTSWRTNDFRIWNRLSSDADEFLYSYEVYDESTERNDSRRTSATVRSEDELSMENNDESRMHKVAEMWYASADETEKLCISGVTTHRWIDDENAASTHQLMVPRNWNLDAILKNDIVIEDQERQLKMRFNDLFEEMRRAKADELKRAKERIDRLRHCASELKTMFEIDCSLGPIEVPNWNNDEIPDYVVTVEEREMLEKRLRRVVTEMKIVDMIRENEEEENGKDRDDIHTRALKEMMDGVLELKWEDEVKKEVSVPTCLLTKNPFKYTSEDMLIIVAYKFRAHALKKKREKYKVMLQNEITEIKEILQKDIAAFDDRLKNFELKKIQIECAIFQERLMRMRAIRRYRTEVDSRREIARFTDEELTPASRRARKLAEEYNSLETVVVELKVRYDNLCKAEKRQEAKFRSEFADLKQPIVEHLLRHYKKRPKVGRFTSTSVTYLTEVARCVVSGEKSDILPREFLDFLRALDALDAMPGNLPPQINVSHWRAMCKLRRMKIETETKVKCCAVEMAEAEQTLSFYQRTMQSADNIVTCKKVNLDDTEKTLTRLVAEMEVQLVLKMGQIEVPLRGCPADYASTVLVTREELLRVNDCIVETGKRKLAAMQKSIQLRKVVSQHEWRHACAKMMLDDLQQQLKDVRRFKITRDVLEYLTRCLCGISPKEDYERIQADLWSFQNRFRELLKSERGCLKEMKRQMAKWRKKSNKISREIESKESDVEERRKLLNDSHRKKDEKSRRMRLAMIARRTRLIIKAEDNYEQLLTLHAHLEVLKLRTYPTLRFKT